MKEKKKALIVIGGGAAGFFCAANAAKNNVNLTVIILEKSSKLLSKVRVSGGGRCNVTHHCFDVEELVKKYPRGLHFLKKTLYHFNTKHTVDWFEERGVLLKTEEDGRMFPQSNTSQTIVDCLLKEANKFGVEIMMNADVKQLTKEENFCLQLADGRELKADYVGIACGGFSKTEHFKWLEQLGHTFETPVPSLFTFNMPGNNITTLMGVSIENVSVKILGGKLSQQGAILITHWGLSGPAILRLSAWAARELAKLNYHFSILINWLPQYNEQTLKESWLTLRSRLAAQNIGNKNPFLLPSRLWQYFLQQADINSNIRWAEITAKQQNKLMQTLTAQLFEVQGKTTFKEEFVTCGGIKLSEINAATMESRIVPNLYFAGEIMDVDGITGGFNFQHAWTSGWIAAKAIAEAAFEPRRHKGAKHFINNYFIVFFCVFVSSWQHLLSPTENSIRLSICPKYFCLQTYFMLEPWRTGKILKIENVTFNTRRFWIEVQDVMVFDFKPGQFVTLDLPISEKRNKRWRSYSIASHPDGSNVIELIIVLLEGGLGTNYLFNEISVGSELTLRGPQGVFVLPDKIEKDLFLICTGTGVAPFRAMAQYLHLQDISHQNIYLIFGCRLLSDCLYKEELETLANEMQGFYYLPTFSREEPSNTYIRHGYVHHVYEEIINQKKPAAQFYLCGWKAMIDQAKANIIALGYDKHDVHLELYG